MPFRSPTAGPVDGDGPGNRNSNGSWTITGIDATYSQVEVAGIIPLNTSPFFLYSNLYYRDSPNAVDHLGIVFNVPGAGQVNLCYYTPSGGCGNGGYASILWDGSGHELTQVGDARFGRRCRRRVRWFCWAAGWRQRESRCVEEWRGSPAGQHH